MHTMNYAIPSFASLHYMKIRLVTLYENDPDFVFIYFTEVLVTETKIKAEYQYMLSDSYKDGVIWFPHDLLNKSDEDVLKYFKEKYT